jgi:hypothetical protein
MLAACGVGATAPEGARPPVVRVSGLRYDGELVQGGPEIVVGRVVVANPSREPRALRFPDRCVALLRLYFPDGRRVWDQRIGNKTCEEPAVEVELGPGGERSFERAAFTAVVLENEHLPEGNYRVTIYLRPVGESEIELPLGTVSLTRPRREPASH